MPPTLFDYSLDSLTEVGIEATPKTKRTSEKGLSDAIYTKCNSCVFADPSIKNSMMPDFAFVFD